MGAQRVYDSIGTQTSPLPDGDSTEAPSLPPAPQPAPAPPPEAPRGWLPDLQFHRLVTCIHQQIRGAAQASDGAGGASSLTPLLDGGVHVPESTRHGAGALAACP